MTGILGDMVVKMGIYIYGIWQTLIQSELHMCFKVFYQ